MSVFWRGTEARGSYFYEFEAGCQRYRRGRFPTKRLAELAQEAERRRLATARVERVYGVRVPDSVDRARAIPTLAAYVQDAYLPHHVATLAKSSQKTARSQLAAVVRQLGALPLDQLGPRALDRYVAARLNRVSAAQVNLELNRLSWVVNHARARGVLSVHPFQGYKRPRATQRDYHLVTATEERALLRAAPEVFRDWLPVALDTGMRKGELRLLRCAHVAVDGADLRVSQSKVRGRVKVIPLTARTRAIVRRRLGLGGVYLFDRGDGQPWSLAWVDQRWEATRETAGIRGVRFQDLRHTFATRMAEQGESVATVGELLGHQPPYAMTLRYFHVLEASKRQAIARLSRGARRR